MPTLTAVSYEAVTAGKRAEAERLQALGERICRRAAHIAAATYQELVDIADFDTTRGWANDACRSCAHWLNWRCGYDLRSAREKVRVAHALVDLPKISAAFAAGELSYSKVRAMTRVATPEAEDDLLAWARHGTAAHLEKIVRWTRRREREAEAQDVHDDRYLRWDWSMDGSLRIEAKLPPEVGALVLQALQAARDELRAQARQDGSAEPLAAQDGSAEHLAEEGDGSSEEPSTAQVQVDALALLAESALAGGIRDSKTADRYQVSVFVDASALALGDGDSHLVYGPALPAETVRRLTCDCGIVPVLEDGDGRIVDVGRKTRSIPPATRRALQARDRGCVVPGCNRHRFTDGHHIQHWVDGGSTDLDNLALLCRSCHVAYHEGGFSIVRQPDGTLAFFRPDGTPLQDEPLRADGSLEATQADLPIDAATIVADWDGGPCDYSVAVEGLLNLRGWGYDWPMRRKEAVTVPRNRTAS